MKTIQSDCDTGLPDNCVDVVLLYDTFHNLAQPDDVLRELHRVLKSDGTLTFSDHHMKAQDILTGVTNMGLFRLSTKGRMTYVSQRKDNGIKTLAKVASTKAEYNALVFAYLIEQLKNCRSKSVPQYGESMMIAVTSGNKDQYHGVLKKRFDELSTAQQRRVKKLLRAFEK